MKLGMSKNDSSAKSLRRWFQFSLFDMLILTVCVAIGFSLRHADRLGWVGYCGPSIPVLILAICIAVGLAWQAFDMWHALRSGVVKSREEHWGWLYSIVWRLAVVALIVVHYLSLHLPNPVENDQELYVDYSRTMRDAGFALCLVVALCSVRLPRPSCRPTIYRRIIGALCILGGLIVAPLIWANDAGAPADSACYAFEADCGASARTRALNGTGELDWVQQAREFTRVTWMSLGFVGLGGASILAMVSRWHQHMKRLFWAGVVAIALTLAAGCVVWIYGWGFRRLCPVLPESLWQAPLFYWMLASLFAIFIVTPTAWRLCHDSAQYSPATWRHHATYYYHERLITLLILAVVMIGCYVNMFVVLCGKGCYDLDRWYTYNDLYFFPQGYLRLALLFAVLIAIWRRCRSSGYSDLSGPASLDPSQFMATWCALLGLFIVGVPTIACLVFAYWLAPWF